MDAAGQGIYAVVVVGEFCHCLAVLNVLAGFPSQPYWLNGGDFLNGW